MAETRQRLFRLVMLTPGTLAGALATAHAADKLTYFTWSGYELPEFNESFTAAHPDSVDISMFGDDDDAFTKVKAGFRPDLVHPCYDKIARWNKEGLLQPIETAKIKNWDKIFPAFRDLPDIQAGEGKSGWYPSTGATPLSFAAPILWKIRNRAGACFGTSSMPDAWRRSMPYTTRRWQRHSSAASAPST